MTDPPGPTDPAGWPGTPLDAIEFGRARAAYRRLVNPRGVPWSALEAAGGGWHGMDLDGAIGVFASDARDLLLVRTVAQGCEYLGDVERGYAVDGAALAAFVRARIRPDAAVGTDFCVMPEDSRRCFLFTNLGDIYVVGSAGD